MGVAALAVLALVARGREGVRQPDALTATPTAVDSARVRTRLFWERYRAATRYRTTGEYPSAAAEYEAALALDGSHEDALYYLGNVEAERGRYREAERAWRRLVAVNPTSDRGYGRLGELHLCLPDPEWRDLPRAETDFQRSLYINREQTGPLLRLGQIALLSGRTREAAGYFDAVLGTNAGSALAHYFAGYLAWKHGDEGGASRHYARALAGPPAQTPGSNEGDTRTKPAASPLQDPTCPLFHAQLATIRDAGPPIMEENYRRLDGFLARITQSR
jgi:tetratricopeptide (TPR) repeat protein